MTRSALPSNIVFIPGFMCDERLFQNQSNTLNKLGIPNKIETPKAGATLSEFASNILAQAPNTFALAGLSMGGIIALKIMRLAPERVTHLALLNTTPHADRSLTQRKDHIRRARNGELMTILKDELKPKYLSPATSKETLVPLISKMAETLGLDSFIRQSIALMIRQSSLPILKNITCPTLILTGSDDAVCPPALHEEMASHIKGSTLKIVPNCGHLSTLEAPTIVTQELLKHWGFEDSNILHFPKKTVDFQEQV